MTPPTAAPAGRRELLAEAVLNSRMLLARYLAGFNEVTHVRQTPDLPNHVAWTLGHLALTMHRVAEKLDGQGLPAGDFVIGDGHAGSREKGVFDSEAVSFGSRPEERHDRFPSLARGQEIFGAACERLARALREADEARLDEPARWGQTEIPMWSLIVRMVFHNGFHTGQIADLRRALGFKSVFA